MAWMKELMDREPLTKKQILDEIRRVNEDGTTTMGFCSNSRLWCIFMFFNAPKTCPYDNECEGCSYHKLREPTDYLIRKLQDMRWGIKEEG